MLAVLYGLREQLIGPESPIWMCSNCFTCFDRCPQDVKPIEVIVAIKNLMGRQGIVPQGVGPAVEGILKTGRSALVTKRTERRREELDLPPLREPPIEQMQALVSVEGGGSWQEEASPAGADEGEGDSS
jgi:heterodisulfide reductase subunit C